MEEILAAGALASTEVIKTLAKDMTSFLKEKIKGYYKDVTSKELIDSGWAFEDYLDRTYKEYYKSKSILYTIEARELSSFFVPSYLRVDKEIVNRTAKWVGSGRKFSAENLREVLEEGNKIIITGIGGLGKTMHMKHFCINAIETGYKIPVYIPLRYFNEYDLEGKTLKDLLYDKLTDFGFKLDSDYFAYSLEGDKYVFLFDGYDEVSNDKRPQIAIKIQRFCQQYPYNSFIISSRHLADIYGWDNFKILSLCPLNREQSIQLIWKLDFSYELKKRFIDELNWETYSRYASFMSNPLLLSILFLTYSDNMFLPETLQDFYERAFETMLYRRDQLKNGLKRNLSSRLSYEDFRSVFLTFCFRTYFQEKYSFSSTELINNISMAAKKCEIETDSHKYKSDLVDITCMLYEEGHEYTFIHRSFQEYFAALYTSQRSDTNQYLFFDKLIKSLKYREKKIGEATLKLLDFFKMLYSIEPFRFENIVLKPILEKIYKIYEDNDRDLVKTISCFFAIDINEGDPQDYDPPSCGVYIRMPILEQYGIKYEEFSVLYEFKRDPLAKNLNCSKKEIENILKDINFDHVATILMDNYDNNFNENDKLSIIEDYVGTGDLLFESWEFLVERITEKLFRFFIIGIKRYKELTLPEEVTYSEFESLLNTF